jgi:hypothetical protein
MCSPQLNVARGADPGRKATEQTEDPGPLRGAPGWGGRNIRRANNLTLRGGGLHHVAVEASNFDRSLRF